VDLPNQTALVRVGEIHKEHAVESFGPREFGRQFANVIGGGYHKYVRFVIVEPGQEGAEQPGRDTTVRLTASRNAAEGFFDLIEKTDGGSHRVDQPQRPPNIGLALSDERAQKSAHVEDQRGPARFIAKRFRKGRLAT